MQSFVPIGFAFLFLFGMGCPDIALNGDVPQKPVESFSHFLPPLSFNVLKTKNTGTPNNLC